MLYTTVGDSEQVFWCSYRAKVRKPRMSYAKF